MLTPKTSAPATSADSAPRRLTRAQIAQVVLSIASILLVFALGRRLHSTSSGGPTTTRALWPARGFAFVELDEPPHGGMNAPVVQVTIPRR